jgi:hypothetical protein
MQWFVEPGAHVVSARKEGYLDGTEKADVAIGPPKTVFVKLQRVVGGGAVEATPAPPQPDTAEPATAAPAGSSVSASATPILKPRTVVLIGGAALAVTAFGLAVVYNAKAANDISDRNDVRQQFVPLGGLGTNTCAQPVPAAKQPCESLASAETKIKQDMNYRLAFGVTGGVLAVATVATYFLWPARDRATATTLAPVWDSSQAGISVSGRF